MVEHPLNIYQQHAYQLSLCPCLLHSVEHSGHGVNDPYFPPGSNLILVEHIIYLTPLYQHICHHLLADLADGVEDTNYSVELDSCVV